jgi:hypothetical protein
VGNWACDDTVPTGGTDSFQTGAVTMDSTRPPLDRSGATPLAVSGTCEFTGGCWKRYDDYRADWSGTVAYGYGKDRLGTATGYVFWQLTGSQSVSKPVQFKATGETQHQGFSATLYNGAPGIPHGGSPIRGTTSVSGFTGLVAPGHTVNWGPNGYKARSGSQWDHNVVTEWSWSVPGYPGYWYFYSRSLVSHTTKPGNGAIYRFDQVVHGLPGDEKGSGHRR